VKKQAVIPAKAGIHFALDGKGKINMDSGFRRNDDLRLAHCREKCLFSQIT
jgi:hypothetical protein